VKSVDRRARWTAIQGFSLLWRSWGDGEFVVYHTGSGETHLLNEVSAEALRQLDASCLDARELAARVAVSLGRANGESLEPHIEDLMLQLDELGLIEPVT
jgi:PqqD family protein of HPr-rel-A system